MAGSNPPRGYHHRGRFDGTRFYVQEQLLLSAEAADRFVSSILTCLRREAYPASQLEYFQC